MLLVVRQHHCDRNALFAATRQIDFVEGRVLGVVYNCANEEGKGYGYYKKYYRRYYSKYGYRYEGTYMAAGKAAKAAAKAEPAQKEEK
jgi:Mrp family chromosome partitioning ATPase